MSAQLEFPIVPSDWPDGFKYRGEFISRALEATILQHLATLPFRDFEFHGFVGKRRTVSFGWEYNFNTEMLAPAEPAPEFLRPLREAAAGFAGVPPDSLVQTLVSEYGAGAGIGWHRDKAVFGAVIGVSLLAACQFRLRHREGAKWRRLTIRTEPRSAYLLSGPARTEWEHSIPPVAATRYSVTFRTMR